MAENESRVTRNEAESRYELWLGDTMVGRAEFERHDSGTAFTHTVVDDEYSGQGLGSVLAKGALDDAVARDEIIVPHCPFIQAYLKRHHEYESHVAWPTPKHERR
ncbi:GNAT family N-acetyltransferase [Paramicrobacterium agarici]|uniref:N-acetyltransferase domain-containing protein n=1 Tax=Paramicrobacterium agarici TaxID=630514 RepID=A0A2A9DUQ8_9MICO|nr:GNAT family N-acetyltransferase [Microbacterium agarici]PFG30418.1 DNA polymerase-4/hypothetical protein [Microbacterium agarici]